MIRKLLPITVLFFAFGCSSDDPEPYDPVAQLEIDLRLIDEYLSAQNLQAEIHVNSGMRYIVTEEGQGELPEPGKRVFVHYETFLLDGTFIDTSIEQTARDNGVFNSSRDYRPFDFVLGSTSVIGGFNFAVELLNEGGSGTFLIPSVHAYKDTGIGGVPPNTNLLFNITLVEIQN